MAQSIQVKAVNHRHERLADILIAEPHLRMHEVAKRLGLSEVWISIVKQSDSFKDYWALRSKAHSDAITAGIKEKAAALAELSLEVLLQDTVEKVELGVMPAGEARENLDLVTKRFAFDGSNQPQGNVPPNITFNFGLVSQESLERARAKLRGEEPKQIEGEVIDEPAT